MSAVPAVLPNPLAGTTAQRLRAKVGLENAFRACAPWLIARGQSLEVPRLDRVRASPFVIRQRLRRGPICLRPGRSRHREPIRLEACGGEPRSSCGVRLTVSSAPRRIRDRRAFELSVTLSTDPHEWCETEDEPDGSQIFLSVEAHSCGFVNLGPALALCENEHPRLPATFARIFLNGIGSCFRIYDDRDAEEHISILEDNYDPTEDAEALSAMPDRGSILAALHEAKATGPRGNSSRCCPDGA